MMCIGHVKGIQTEKEERANQRVGKRDAVVKQEHGNYICFQQTSPRVI